MAKPRLVKVRALFYVLQQVMNGREKRVHQNFDTPSYCIRTYAIRTSVSGDDIWPYLSAYSFPGEENSILNRVMPSGYVRSEYCAL